jgi:cytochrome c-type biogenesis protein CcmE
MKPKYLIGGAVIAIFLVIGFLSLDNSKIAYTNIAVAEESGKRVQVKGVWVKDKGSDYDGEQNKFEFHMTDEQENVIKVVYAGSRPNNFEIAESIVVKGRVEGETFHADEILTKCPSKYEGSAEEMKTSGV